jgi:hypothetical protein
MKWSASSLLVNTHARATEPVRPARPPDPTPASMSPALMPTSTPQLSPALAVPLIVTFTVPSARISLTPSTPPPKSTAAIRIEPEMPRWDELRTHSVSSGSPLGPVWSVSHEVPAIQQIASPIPPRICPPTPLVTSTATIAQTSSSAPRYSAEVWPQEQRKRVGVRTAAQDARAPRPGPESRVLSWA